MAEYLGTVEFGALYHKGTPLPRPTRPWHTGASFGNGGIGNIPTCEAYFENYSLGNTPSDNSKKLKWNKIKDGNKMLLICDRNILVNVSWDTLNYQGYVAGKNIVIDGVACKARLLTGGSSFRETPSPGGSPRNEWESFVRNEDNLSGLPKPNNRDLDGVVTEEDRIGILNKLWNWAYCHSWCQERHATNYGASVLRGGDSVSDFLNGSSWGKGNNFGWRPVLEILNASPIISGTDINLGIIKKEPSYSYTVSDPNNDLVTITEKLDGKTLRTLTNGEILGGGAVQYTHDEWLRTPNGPHAITIEANDRKGGTAVRTVGFTKKENKIIIQKKTPFVCDARPEKILLTPTWRKEGAIAKVEVCNNAFDEAPTWEDATNRILLNKVYRFTNETKTASSWGIKYRITLTKNEGYQGEINISSIGGAFE